MGIKEISIGHAGDDSSEVQRTWNLSCALVRRRLFPLGGLVIAASVGAAVAAMVTSMSPRNHVASVRLEIPPFPQDYRPFCGCATVPSLDSPPSFIQTQFDVISSGEILDPVVDDFELMRLWNVASKADAYLKLVNNMKTEEVPGADFARIKVQAAEPQLALNLAHAIAGVIRGITSKRPGAEPLTL